ncbi:hypothetical protein LMG19282_01444 [Cupriavidus campinensis]|nr:hypothetical protein LMG19282_01444 [Cupriavidus campinensis]
MGVQPFGLICDCLHIQQPARCILAIGIQNQSLQRALTRLYWNLPYIPPTFREQIKDAVDDRIGPVIPAPAKRPSMNPIEISAAELIQDADLPIEDAV